MFKRRLADSVRWHLSGRDVCKNCWQCAYGVSDFKLENCGRILHGNSLPREDALSCDAIAWLGNYFDLVADYMPNMDIRVLPMHTEWKEVYATYVSDMFMLGNRFIGRTYFFSLRKKHFKNVKRAPFTRLGKCQICIEYHDLNFRKMDPADVRRARAAHQRHIAEVTRMRKSYDRRKMHSRTRPDEALSVIFDHTNPFQTPTFYPVPKRLAMFLEKLQIHLCGLIGQR
eukprot:TRINITY_DN4504_c0_g2_i1.p2 TRINITY_DN4504_c0_g2~~TRINITY_DN4504_c0_g2_i1.p2  ORF type:complete len:228 (-),score=16.76 TRINITY_DN4504_c0_g2_i1:14-697(-)